MSYDISLRISTGIEEREVVEVGNMTYNVSPMYAKAMPGIKSLTQFNGMQADFAAPVLEAGVREMQTNPDVYRKLNPANGWGDYEGALAYLEKFLRECRANPKCIISVH